MLWDAMTVETSAAPASLRNISQCGRQNRSEHRATGTSTNPPSVEQRPHAFVARQRARDSTMLVPLHPESVRAFRILNDLSLAFGVINVEAFVAREWYL